MLKTVQHPDKRDIRQGPGLFEPAQLTADIAVTPTEPDLFHSAWMSRRAFPENWREGLAVLVERQRVVAVPDARAKRVVVEGMLDLFPFPDKRRPQAQ